MKERRCTQPCYIDKFPSHASSRKGDQPAVIHFEGSAAVLSRQLLQIHRLSDHTALQQGSGVDHLLQASVSVPLTGMYIHTHIYVYTHTHVNILHARSDPICVQSVDHSLPHGVNAQPVFLLICRSSFFPFPSFLSSSSAYETITACVVDD